MQFIQEISARDAAVSRTQAPDDEGVLSVRSARLGEVAGDIGTVRYDLNSQKRAYLLAGDLATGIIGTEFLHLPQLALDATEPRTVNILPFDSRKWSSVRVYDTGLCSLAPTEALDAGEALEWPNLAKFLLATIDAEFAELGGVRTIDAHFDVVLNSTRQLETMPRDAFRFSVQYENVDYTDPCGRGTVAIDASVSLQRTPGELSNVPQCPTPADITGGGQTIAGTFDFPGVVRALTVTASGAGPCPTLTVVNGITEKVRNALTFGLAKQVNDRLLVNPRDFGYGAAAIPRCTCDDECNATFGPADPYLGRRSRCHFYTPGGNCGECWLQLEADRISMRPEGLEIVLAEDTDDVQWSLFERAPVGIFLCSAFRDPVVLPDELPLLGTLPSFGVPPPVLPPPTEPPTCPLAGL